MFPPEKSIPIWRLLLPSPSYYLVKEALIRLRVKHVFIIFQENRSFDHYFGTFPGADGLFNADGQHKGLGSTQAIVNTDGSVSSISPFLIPQTVTNTARYALWSLRMVGSVEATGGARCLSRHVSNLPPRWDTWRPR